MVDCSPFTDKAWIQSSPIVMWQRKTTVATLEWKAVYQPGAETKPPCGYLRKEGPRSTDTAIKAGAKVLW